MSLPLLSRLKRRPKKAVHEPQHSSDLSRYEGTLIARGLTKAYRDRRDQAPRDHPRQPHECDRDRDSNH